MKSKLFTIVVIFSILMTNSHAQYLRYDLSKYKLPNTKTNKLDLNLFVNQSHNSNSSHYPEYSFNPFQKTSNYGGLIDVDYYNFRNSKKYQGTQQVVLNLRPNILTLKTHTDTLKRKSLIGQFSFSSRNRFYNRSNIFLEVDPYLSYYTNFRKSSDTDITGEATDSDSQLTSSLPISIGFGRIEPVEDARLAIYIIEELTKKGKIINPPTESVITEFAQKISKIKRKRFFDSRLRKIEELQVIDSFLISNNIVSSSDIEYFTALRDQWDYAAGPTRKTGFSINSGFDNSINIDKSIESVPMYDPEIYSMVYDKRTTTSNIYKAGVFLRIDYSKPLNLYWQSDLYSLSSYNLEITRDPSDKEDIDDNFETNILYTSLNYTIKYLPNSRTSIGLTVGGYYKNLNGDRARIDISGPIDGYFKGYDFSLNASIDMYYYFSPQLRIILDLNLNSLYNKSTIEYVSIFNDDISKNNYFTDNFSIGFVYSFF